MGDACWNLEPLPQKSGALPKGHYISSLCLFQPILSSVQAVYDFKPDCP